MADAIVTAWNSKNFYNFWRPITAIQQGDYDGNRRTAGDANWLPLITTPNYPDYTSGSNNLAGSVTGMLRLFFGTDRMAFSVTSEAVLAVNKTCDYTRFSDAAADVVEARILEGIHFGFADTAARAQGRRVAKWAFKRLLRPLDDDDDDDDDEDDEDDNDE